MTQDSIPDYCPDFENHSELDVLKNVTTQDVLEWLGRNRFQKGFIMSTIEDSKPGFISVKTLLKGENADLELLHTDIQTKLMERLKG